VVGLLAYAACDCQCCKRGDGETVATAPAAKAKDPVCGIDVDPAEAIKVEPESEGTAPDGAKENETIVRDLERRIAEAAEKFRRSKAEMLRDVAPHPQKAE
jgi:hypothetical protein